MLRRLVAMESCGDSQFLGRHVAALGPYAVISQICLLLFEQALRR
jgi:hypothetical protein